MIHERTWPDKLLSWIVFVAGVIVCLCVIGVIIGSELWGDLVSLTLRDIPIMIGIFLLEMVILFLTLRSLSDKNARSILILTLVVCAVLRVCYVLIVQTEPTTDFKMILDAAEMAAVGDYSWSHVDSGYFYCWAYQIPFVLYEAVILRIFHSVLAIKLLNVAMMVGIDYLIYRIAAEMTSKRAGVCAAFVYAIFPGSIHYSSVLTNQHIASFLMMASILCLIMAFQKPNIYTYIFAAGVILGFSELMRPETIVLIATYLFLALWRLFSAPSKRRILKMCVVAAVFSMGYLGVTKGAEMILIQLDLAPNGIGNAVPEWKFVCGLNYDTSGQLSYEHIYLTEIKDKAVRVQEAKQIILHSVKNGNPVSFFIKKIKIMWGNDQYGYWALWNYQKEDYLFSHCTVGKFEHLFHLITLVTSVTMWTLSLLSFVIMRKNGIVNWIERLICVFIIGCFCVFLLIEVQCKYRYFVMPFVSIMMTPTLCAFEGRNLRRK